MDRSHGTVALLRVPPRFRRALCRKSTLFLAQYPDIDVEISADEGLTGSQPRPQA
ncbi:hypothetical protein GGE62_005531 [Rhizobium leguminosarum]|nr:hypothetical protein [Rhizobium leguminosarum]